MKRWLVFLSGAIVAAMLVLPSAAMPAEKVKRLTKEEVGAELANPDWVIVDVRFPKTWKAGDLKIQGAVVEDAETWRKWIDQYGKEKTLVLYCS